MGWTKLEDRWTYVAPDLALTGSTLLDEAPQVDLESRLKDYRLRPASWDDSLRAFEAVMKVIPAQLAPACIAFALLPVVQRFFPAAAPRPALHLVGTTGSGKSEIAALLCSFYGQFYRDAPPAQWGDTINTVEALGYQLADALYWVDDYKTIYADEKTFTRFLQSYSRGMGRGRLTREARLRRERPCRGLLLSTGETMIAGEASVIARTLMLEIPPWEKRDPQGAMLDAMEPLRGALSGFTVKFSQWIAKQVEAHQLIKTLDHDFAESERAYRAKLSAQPQRHTSTGRIIQNWAVLVTVYRLLHRFLIEQNAAHVLLPWQDVLLETARAVRQERASEVFLDVLGQLLASGEAVLASNTQQPEEAGPGKTIVGYRDANYVYLLPEVAFRTVDRTQSLKFTTVAIGSQLREDGILLPHNNQPHLTVQIRVRGTRVRLWRLRRDVFEGEINE